MAQRTGLELRGVAESVDLTQPGRQSVPTGAVLVHQPSLPCDLAVASAGKPTFPRRLSVVAAQRRRLTFGWQAKSVVLNRERATVGNATGAAECQALRTMAGTRCLIAGAP